MSDHIKKLRQRKADLLIEADALAAKDADGTISEDEGARYTAILDVDLPKVNASVAREEKLMDERRTMAALPVLPEVETTAGAPRITSTEKDPKKFASFGEQLQMVAKAGMNRGVPYQSIHPGLLYQAAGQGANEAVPSEGGFLVQSDYSTQFLELMHETGELLKRVRRIPIGAQFNGINLPAIDETSRVNGSRFGGVQAYWADEGDTVTATKPKFRNMELKLKKLMALGYATDELLADAAALETVMSQAFTEELTFKTEDAIINGTGAGQPLGILNSGALVTVTPESGQAAATLRTINILNMYSRTPIRSRKSMIWVCNQDIEPQLWTLTDLDTATVQLYTLPGQNGNTSPYGLLLGRPVLPIEYSATLGTVGDLMLIDPMQYVMIDKNGLQQASSMHVRFLQDEMTFRLTFRVDGQPVWRSAVTPFKGSNTISPFVALGTR